MTLAACGGDDGGGPADSPSAPTARATAGTDAATDDADESGGDSTDDATGAAGADLTAAAVAAIGTAETEVSGTAYQVDHEDDDGTREVDVRVAKRTVEVTVSADGATVVSTEEDDDLDDGDGSFFWEVGLEQAAAGDDDVDVRVSVTTGDVVADD